MDIVNKIDLHTHTAFSDGSLTPAQLVASAYEAGLRVVAITDHDTVDGAEEALDEAGRLQRGFILVPGVEISSDDSRPLHILGYFNSKNYTNITPLLRDMERERDVRNHAIIDRLNKLGIRVTSDDVEAIAGKKIYGRAHIASALVKAGISESIDAAFRVYLSEGRKAFVNKRSLPAEECVAAIAGAGGLPVVAHPGLYGLKLSELTGLVKKLSAYGLYGVEAYYPEHAPKETENYVLAARRLNLSVTGGSDFHGEYRKHIRLGTGRNGNLRVPDGVAEELLKALNY